MATKIHANLIEAVIVCLQDTFAKGFYADKVIDYHFKRNKKWGARDRKFIAESVYEMVRYWRYLWYLSEQEETLDDASLETLFFTWWYWQKKEDLLPAGLAEKIDKNLEKDPSPAIVQSYPDDIYDLALEQIGEEWHKIAIALNKPNFLYLRTNTLKTKRKDLIKAFFEQGFEDATQVRENEEGIVIPSKKNVFSSQAFKDGLFEVQDIASQMVGPQLGVEAGMRVVDACAGAGGKSLHLAALMQDKGKIIALDIHENKLAQLKVRARRAGVSILETRLIENSKTIKRLHETADRLLLDVPCSGLGVIRRNPDAKWKLSLDRIKELEVMQADILQRYATILKPGGRMVYATCSLLPSENEQQVQNFLSANKNYQLLGEKTLYPHTDGYDGFYFAVISKDL